MKRRWISLLLVALLFALLAMAGTIAETNDEIELVIDPEEMDIGSEAADIDIPEEVDTDFAPVELQDGAISVDDILDEDGLLQLDAPTAANSFTDGDYDHDAFEINKNGVLVKYNGKGGDVVIPDGVTGISGDAFYDCKSLTSVIIPKSVTYIEDGSGFSEGAFRWCSNLKRVSIAKGLTHIGDYAFSDCESLTSIIIPDSVIKIGEMAFFDCESLSSINIPGKTKSIGDDAFSCCDHLQEISVSGNNQYYASKNGILYTHDMKTLLRCPGAKANVTIPKSVVIICHDAFYGCDRLASVTIPNSIVKIEHSAFGFCENLTSITIPDTVRNIDYEAFYKCKRLTNVTILAETIDINDYAFRDSRPTFHIIRDSDAIEWAEENNYNYDIIDVCLSEEYLDLKSEQTHKLSVIGHVDGKITWSSSNKNVATVDNGNVTAKKVGKCVISAKLSSGKTLKCKVSVYDPAELNDTTLSLNLGDSYKLKVTGLLNRKVTWSSNNTAVVTVKNGKITPKKAGKCTITAKLSKSQYIKARTLTCKVTVTDPAKLSAENLTISTIDSAKIKLTGRVNRTVTWSTSDAGVVKITKSDSGYATIKAVKTGTATITAKIEGGKTLKCAVKVVNPLTIKVYDLQESSIYNELDLNFINNSDKKIVYVQFEVLQYNNRGDKLKSPYSYYYLNENINPHDYRIQSNYYVNDDTKSVKIKINEVTFADKTTWRP